MKIDYAQHDKDTRNKRRFYQFTDPAQRNRGENKTTCKIDGEIKSYDGCSAQQYFETEEDFIRLANDFYTRAGMEYIGTGQVYRVNGVDQWPAEKGDSDAR